MANLQWLKLSTIFFDNNKIKLLESEKDGDTLIRVWIQLLTIAMKCNYQGRLSLTEDKPMTVDEFSKIMGKSNKKIEKILKKFLELGMLKKEGETFLIKNWDKYQSIEKHEKYQIQNRERQRKYREKHKSEIEKSNVIQELGNGEEENKKDLENNKEKNIRKENENGFRQYKI